MPHVGGTMIWGENSVNYRNASHSSASASVPWSEAYCRSRGHHVDHHVLACSLVIMSVGHTVKRRDDEEDSESLPPPDGGWGWMVVFGSFMIHVISKFLTLFTPLYSQYEVCVSNNVRILKRMSFICAKWHKYIFWQIMANYIYM